MPKTHLESPMKLFVNTTYTLVYITVFIAIWSFVIPDTFFPCGACMGIMLPIISLIILLKNMAIVKSPPKSKTYKSRNVGSLLFLPIFLSPILLSIWIIRNVDLIISPIITIDLLSFTLVCVAIIILKVKKLRKNLIAFGLFLSFLCFNFSILICTNSLIHHTVMNYTATVEEKSFGLISSGHIIVHSYYVNLSAWGDHKDRNEFSVPYSIYHRANVGEMLSIQQERGILGIEWYAFNQKS